MSFTIILIGISSLLSLLGDTVIIYMYFKMDLRSNFALKMITYMSVSDLIFSLSNLLYLNPGIFIQLKQQLPKKGSQPESIRCKVQAFLLQSSELSCFIFCFLLNYCIYLTVIKNKVNLQIYKTKFIIIGFLLPLLLSTLPLINGAYGSNTYCCGFAFKDEQLDHHILVIVEALILFFLPLWVFSIGNIYLIVRVVMFISRLKKKDQKTSFLIEETNQEKEIALSQQIVLNMLAYPVIMILTWLPYTIYRAAYTLNYEIVALEGLRFVFADSQGLFNSIAYMVNSIRIMKLKGILQDEGHQYRLVKEQSVTRSINYGSFISLTSGAEFLE